MAEEQQALDIAAGMSVPPADLSGVDPVYIELGKFLDEIGTGFPPSKGLNEVLYYQKIFTPEQARTELGMIPNVAMTAAEYAEKNGCSVDEAEERLWDLSEALLVMRKKRSTGEWEYFALPFAHGLNENIHLKHIAANTRDQDPIMFAQMGIMDSLYMPQFMSTDDPLYHAVPMHEEMVVGGEILPFDNINAILDSRSRFALASCVCRYDAPAQAAGCEHQKDETCIACDEMADFYIATGIGRAATREEVDALIARSEENDQFLQVFSNQETDIICNCCKCGCGILAFPRLFPQSAARKHWTNYPSVQVDRHACIGCGACVKACVMDTLAIAEDGKAINTKDACVGCGLCVRKCPMGVWKLVRKPDEEIYEPPANFYEQYQNNHRDVMQFREQMAQMASAMESGTINV